MRWEPRVGDLVTWNYSGQRLVGRVAAVVAAYQYPDEVLNLAGYRVMFIPEQQADHRSFLVEVLTGTRARRQLHWPLVDMLDPVTRGNWVLIDYLPESAQAGVREEVERWRFYSPEAQR